MFALLCLDGAEKILNQAEDIFQVSVVSKMSELKTLVESGTIEGILIDPRLQVTEAIKNTFVDIQVYEYEEPFMISDVMRWYEAGRNKTQYESPVHEGAPHESAPVEQVIDQEVIRRDLAPPPRTFSSSSVGRKPRKIPTWMFVSPKGGEGRSTIGAHMSTFGALRGKRVGYIDLDPQGDTSARFGLLKPLDVQAARAWQGSSVEEAVRDEVCVVHESGLHIFPSPQSVDVVEHDVDGALHLLHICLDEMDVVFIDMPQGWTPLHKAILPFITEVIVVVSPTTDRLDRVQEFMDKLQMAGITTDEVIPIVNKGQRKSDLRGMQQYLAPFAARLMIPFDKHLFQKGGLNGKKLIRACIHWWEEMYGLRKPETKKRWWWMKR